MGSSVWERLLQMPKIKMQQKKIILTHITAAWSRKLPAYLEHGDPLIHGRKHK